MIDDIEIEKYVEGIKKKVYVDEDVLRRLVLIFVKIRNKNFPSPKPPRGILFYGPPGTGKTRLMKAIVSTLKNNEYEIPNFMISGPEIISEYYGKSEARLRRIFAQAQEAADREGLAIIYIDELDSIAPRRDIVRGELEPRLVGQLLAAMDGLEKEKDHKGHVVVIGSTNRPEALDPALRRPGRFDLEFEFDIPDQKGREEILKILLKEINVDTSESIWKEKIREIAKQTTGFTGADLQHLINEAIMRALSEKREGRIEPEDLMNVVNNITPSTWRGYSIEKASNMEDFSSEFDSEIKEKIKDTSDKFLENKQFKLVDISRWWNKKVIYPSTERKIVSSIAYRIGKKEDMPLIEVRAGVYRSRWFGESERQIRELFAKIRRTQPCIVFIQGLNALTANGSENTAGIINELIYQIDKIQEDNAQVLLLISEGRYKNMMDYLSIYIQGE